MAPLGILFQLQEEWAQGELGRERVQLCELVELAEEAMSIAQTLPKEHNNGAAIKSCNERSLAPSWSSVHCTGTTAASAVT